MDPGAEPGSEAAADGDQAPVAPGVASEDGTNGEAGTDVPADVADTSLVDVSTSRLRVLKALHGRRRTASELARELDLNKSTVHGYLQDLVADGFVDRHEDDDRLWVYYSLTGPGEAIVDRDRLKLVVDLGTLTAFLASAALGVYEVFLAEPAPPTSGPLGGPTVDAGLPWTAVAYAGLLVLTVAGLLAHVYLRRRPVGEPQGSR